MRLNQAIGLKWLMSFTKR